MRNRFDRLLRCGQADPQKRFPGEGLQALKRKSEMRAALVGRQGMNFVDDHGPRCLQHATAGLGAQKDVKGLRRRHHNVWRLLAHAVAVDLGRIAGAHKGANVGVG